MSTNAKTFFDPKKKDKRAHGRINSMKLFGINPENTTDALKEKNYWQLYKNSHPINRWQFRRWEDRIRKENMFTDRVNSLPVDQRYRLKKALFTPNNVTMIIPIGMTLYLGFCYFRYKVWGVTPSEASVGMARYVQLGARSPDL